MIFDKLDMVLYKEEEEFQMLALSTMWIKLLNVKGHEIVWDVDSFHEYFVHSDGTKISSKDVIDSISKEMKR